MLRIITHLLSVIYKMAALVRIVTALIWKSSRIYKVAAEKARKSGIRRINMIRFIGVSVVSLYAVIGTVEAGNKYSREAIEIDQSSIVKTITGNSEIQCILRCRTNAKCDKTVYKKKTQGGKSHCYFLKDGINRGIGDSNKKSGVVHEKIKKIGMS